MGMCIPAGVLPLSMIFSTSERYFSGSWRKSTISPRSSLASSSPATSAKRMPVEEGTYTLAPELPPMPNIMPSPPPMAFFIRLFRK